MLLLLVLLAFIAIAVCLAWYFISHDHGEREPRGALWLAVGFGLCGAIAAAVIEHFVISPQDLTVGRPLFSLLSSTMIVGAVEEACKFLPLAFYIRRKRYFNEHTDGIIYFALAGLGFGLPENILYTIQFGASVGLGRIILTPFFHAATTAMVGYFYAKYRIDKKPLATVIMALVAAMVIHGIYDFGFTSGNTLLSIVSVVITLTMSIGLFFLYMRATDLDKEQGLSVVGNNSFCRACGFPNPKHGLYCTHCGNYA
jgi:RsiW-degrading membrane proteinase PrsW (M82 family)